MSREKKGFLPVTVKGFFCVFFFHVIDCLHLQKISEKHFSLGVPLESLVFLHSKALWLCVLLSSRAQAHTKPERLSVLQHSAEQHREPCCFLVVLGKTTVRSSCGTKGSVGS